MPIFAYFIFGLIVLAIIVMAVVNFMYHNVKKLREAAEDRYYRNLKRKEQKEKNPFGEDYFKSSNKKQNNNRQQSQYASKSSSASSAGSAGPASSAGPTSSASSAKSTSSANSTSNKEDTARRTTTDGGVTIIDDRGEDKQKIFNHDDGEYVEFEEV
jgi:cbb3-type cytochrome oxidase subunit 3